MAGPNKPKMLDAYKKHSKHSDDKHTQRIITNAGEAFEIVAKYLETKKVSPKVEDYNSPSWPYLRADADGYNRALQEVIGILKPKQE